MIRGSKIRLVTTKVQELALAGIEVYEVLESAQILVQKLILLTDMHDKQVDKNQKCQKDTEEFNKLLSDQKQKYDNEISDWNQKYDNVNNKFLTCSK